MRKISCIVEGDGEVAALPVLLRRLCGWRNTAYAEILAPIRVKRDRFLRKPEEFNRYVLLAGGKAEDNGWILILLDSDDDCPAELAPIVLARAKKVLPGRAVSVVFAQREFEAWFIGAAASLNGSRGLCISVDDLKANPEEPRDAKGWLSRRMESRSYGEVTDQPAFAAAMNLDLAVERCKSFQKLCREWDSFFKETEE